MEMPSLPTDEPCNDGVEIATAAHYTVSTRPYNPSSASSSGDEYDEDAISNCSSTASRSTRPYTSSSDDDDVDGDDDDDHDLKYVFRRLHNGVGHMIPPAQQCVPTPSVDDDDDETLANLNDCPCIDHCAERVSDIDKTLHLVILHNDCVIDTKQ